MQKEIFRVQDPDDEKSFIVQRVRGRSVEILRETTVKTGEVPNKNNELITVETITITRQIGEKIQF